MAADGARLDPADITEALIREYLTKEGLTGTLDVFNRERPKRASSITNRSVLRKCLGLQTIAARWKKENPGGSLPTTLQMWVGYQEGKAWNATHTRSSNSQAPPAPAPTSARSAAPAPSAPPSVPSAPVAHHRQPHAPAHPPPPPASFLGASPPASSRNSLTPEDAQLLEATAKAPAAGAPAAGAAMWRNRGQEVEPTGPRASAVGSAERAAEIARLKGPEPRRQKEETMVMEDLDDELASLDLPSAPPPGQMKGPTRIGGGAVGRAGSAGVAADEALSPVTARELRTALWGGTSACPPPSWHQGLFFNTRPGLGYGLVQTAGGPCGVLAAVQAHVLARLLGADGSPDLAVPPQAQASVLLGAVSDVLWRAGGGASATLAWSGAARAGALDYDALVRSLCVRSVTSRDELERALAAQMPGLMDPKGWGLINLLHSLLLTRGIERVHADMDQPNISLCASHGYCTQDLVHLLLTGAASSNVFDGVRNLDGLLLRGIQRKPQIGLLTLFEWYKSVEVGAHLKRPELPIWVVQSESHFTVLFGTDARCQSDDLPFDVMFYDGLANQEAPIRLSLTRSPTGGLTARVGDSYEDRGKVEGQLIPPLQCVIETRWPGVDVNWNGTEPIL